MDKYRDNFNQRVKPRIQEDGSYKVDPFRDAQVALGSSQFVSRERNDFFDDAYAEILSDFFVTWLKSEPHAQKEREFLYASAMALGSVKGKLIDIEQYGKNMKFLNNQQKSQEGETDNE